MAAEYIFTMHKCSRFYPPDREVLKDISLSFFPGAKIGVLGMKGPDTAHKRPERENNLDDFGFFSEHFMVFPGGWGLYYS